MRTERARAAALALSALLACCRSELPPSPVPSLAASPAASQAAAATPSNCRVGPNGSADRGIGGTGGPVLTADRGIGGTGEPTKSTNLADRGIGGTGIIGVITGFASVCLAGQEVALPPDVPIVIDQLPASADLLRAGQVAVIDAASDPTGLRARRIVIRYEAVGLVERVDGDMIRVAGQDVSLSPQTWGTRPARGGFVAVSGLRRGDGVIEATRVETVPPGPVLVHGRLVEEAGGLRIGALPLRRDPATVALVGNAVTVTGMIAANGELLPFSITPDLLLTDPGAYFGPQVGVVLFEGFAVVDGGRLRLAPGFSAPAPGLRFEGVERGVFRFERVDGGLRATGFGNQRAGFTGPPGFGSAPRFEPAPMPNRAIRGTGGSGDHTGSGSRGYGPRGRFGRGRSDDTTGVGPPNGGAPGDGPPRGR